MGALPQRPRWAPVCALVLLFLCAAAPAQAPEEPDRQAQEAEAAQKLEAVRGEIRALTEAQRALEGERAEAANAIREADQAVDAGARALREVDAALAERQAELAKLETDKAALQQRLGTQREALADLLRSAYALGRHEQLKLLLAQDRVDDLARVLAYHRYFQHDRAARIEKLLGELRGLARLGQAVIAKREELAQTRRGQEQRIAELETQRAERRTVLAKLDAQFEDARARLAALGRDERALMKLLASLRDVFADIPRELDGAQPFAQRKGRLPLPFAGKLLAGFGATLPDGRTSQGWLLAGKSGEAVHALAPGRVAFADWLKGYGLLVILDHGDGWMSLYAQNDSLLKEVGDWVGAGEALAGVGSSGGQAQPALYLELRQNGKPVNPKGWFQP
jgi:septal ring factor EnvC (AmiA/AmiB activator)